MSTANDDDGVPTPLSHLYNMTISGDKDIIIRGAGQTQTIISTTVVNHHPETYMEKMYLFNINGRGHVKFENLKYVPLNN